MGKTFIKNSKVSAAGSHFRTISPEEPLVDLNFKIHKFNVRKRPDKKDVHVFPIFSEFGCEVISSVYCLPAILKKTPGKYTIVVGWHGREYLYRHLVDEFWELDRSHMHLREYCRAFHHESKNLNRLEKDLSGHGRVIPIGEISNFAVFPKITTCPDCKTGSVHTIDDFQICQQCSRAYSPVGLFEDIPAAKRKAVRIPTPSDDKMKWARDFLPENPVGVCARHRVTWGRNFPSLFYEQLIFLLEDRGYNPVWIGEPATTLPCPLPRIPDYSRTKHAEDLEQTIALVKNLKFTVQYYTASTRLACLAETPFVIFESPDQICGRGQEGIRLDLLAKTGKKLVLCEYQNAVENQWEALGLTMRAVRDVENGDFSDIIGMVADENQIKMMMGEFSDRLY